MFKMKTVTRTFGLASVVGLVLWVPLLSSANKNSSVNITIVNTSNREIVHIYLSHVDQDDWGGNQLGENAIASGQSYTLSNVSWDSSDIKLNAEDREGCFLTHVSPGSGAHTWTVTNNDQANCGGN